MNLIIFITLMGLYDFGLKNSSKTFVVNISEYINMSNYDPPQAFFQHYYHKVDV